MLRCSRFVPALILSFAYACVVPVSILVRMHSAGLPWIWNDTAFGFFMLVVFPFAVAVYSCVVDGSLLKGSVTRLSKLTVPVVIFVVALSVLPRGVYLDLIDTHRAKQPYMFRDASRMFALDSLHDQAFVSSKLSTVAQEYRKEATPKRGDLSPAMLTIIFACNFLNAGFGIAVFCYILLVSMQGPVGPEVCNHLVFVLATMSLWFPCRAYADWYTNLGDFSWISTYAAAAVLAVLFIGAAIILAIRMAEGSLYHRFVVPASALSAALGALAALKPQWLSKAAVALQGYDPIYRIGFAVIIVALLYYISSTIHQRSN